MSKKSSCFLLLKDTHGFINSSESMVALPCRWKISAFENRIPACMSFEIHFIKINYASFKLLLRLWCKDRLETWDMGFKSRFSIPQRKQQGLEENTVCWASGSPKFSPSGFDTTTFSWCERWFPALLYHCCEQHGGKVLGHLSEVLWDSMSKYLKVPLNTVSLNEGTP